MAVEIPVIIDIEKAFDDAARRVDYASKPLKRRIDELNGEMFINVSAAGDVEGSYEKLANILKNVRDYVGDTNFAMIKLQNALQNTKQKYDELNASIAHRGTPATYKEKERLRDMQSAIIAMEQEIELRTRSSRIVSEEARRQIAVTRAIDDGNAALEREAKTMKEISEKISALNSKLQNIDPDSVEWSETAEEIRKATEELSEYEKRLRRIINPESGSAEGSVNKIKEEMQRLQREWNAMARDDKFSPSGRFSSRAQALVDEYRRLSEESDRYGQSLSQAAGKATASVNRTTNALNRQTRSLSNLTHVAAKYFSFYGLLRFAKQVRDVTAELEFQRVALQRLIQDEEYGAQLFERIKAAAQESPFRIQQLVTYTKQLAAYRIEQEKLFDTTMMLADISAGLGVEMNRLILAYGQVRSASVLRGQELRQFTEAGIPLVQLLADKFSDLNGKMVKTADVFELISKRAVPFSMISEIFEDMTEKGGMFYEMQAKQAETLKGRWEKLKDAFDVGLQSVGETKTFEIGSKLVINTLSSLAKNLRVIVKLIEAGTAAWATYTLISRSAAAAVSSVASSEARAAAVTEAHTIAAQRGIRRVDAFTNAFVRQKFATNALTKTFWKLWSAIVANPLGAVLALISAVTSAIFLFNKKTDKAANSFDEFDKLIEKTSKGLSDTKKIDKLIDRYDILTQKTDRTIKENNRLYQTMSRLQEAFPQVAVGIDDESNSLDEQIIKLRELNEEEEKRLRNAGETSLRAKEIELEDAEKERNKLYKTRLNLQKSLADVENGRVQKGSQAEKSWTKQLNDTNESIVKQDEYIGKLQKRIERLYAILYPNSDKNPLNAWQKQIQEMSEINVNGVASQIFTPDDIEKWETLDQALTTISGKIKQAQEREDALSNSVKSQTGAIKEQIEAELEWVRVERMRLEAMERFFKTPTLFAESLSKKFSDILLGTFDEGNIRKWGEAALAYITMQTNLRFNPELLLARPLVDAAKLVEKGWEDAGSGIATVFSSIYDWEDEKGNKHNVMVTPILPDGSVLSPEELDAYVRDVLVRTNFKEDDKQLLLGIDVTEDAGERLHEMQERYYQLVQMSENLPEDFLFSQEDLQKLKQASDVVELTESKIKNIEEEIKKTEGINIEAISDEEAEKTRKYLENLYSVYDVLKKIRDYYKKTQTEDYSYIAQEIIDNFKDVLGRNFGNESGSGVTIPVDFLITDKELQGLNNTADLFDVLDSKISGIRDELEKVASQNLEGVITDEAREQAELYQMSLQSILNTLLIIRGQYQNTFSPLAKEIQGMFPRLMESYYAGKDINTYVKTGLFSEEDLKRLHTYVDLQDLVTSKYSAVKSSLEKYNGELSETIDLETRRNLLAQIEQLKGDKEAIEALARAYGIILEKVTDPGQGEDPWIIIYKNRLKFVQDFSKGVQDLNKYMAQNNAIAKEREIMEGRGKNLGFTGKNGELDVMGMTGSRQEVLRWYDDTIEKIKKKIYELGGKTWSGLGVQAILAKDTKNRTLKAWQDLLADVFKQKTDFDLSQTEKDLEDAIQNLKEDIKQSEAARNFFQDIFDATGDQDLATNMTVSIYGGVGKDFKDRMEQQLNEALMSLDLASIPEDVFGQINVAVVNRDFETLMKLIGWFPTEWQKMIREMAQDDRKYYEDISKNLVKSLKNAKTYSEKRIEIAEQTAKRMAEIDSLRISDEQKSQLKKQNIKKEADDTAKLMYDTFKETPMYVELFANLDEASTRMLTNMRSQLSGLKGMWKDNLAPTEMKELQSRIEELDKQIASRNPFTALQKAIRNYQAMTKQMSREEADEAAITAAAEADAQKKLLDEKLAEYEAEKAIKDETDSTVIALRDEVNAQKEVTDKAIANAEAAQDTANSYRSAAQAIKDAADKMKEWGGYIMDSLGGIKDIVDTVASDDVADTFNILYGGVEKTTNGITNIVGGIGKIIAGDFKGIVNLIEGIGSALAGIFGIGIQMRVKAANKEIERQQKVLDSLERSYQKLSDAMDEAFGNDYLYNYAQQLENLQSQIEAYRAQAAAERSKGKKADENKALEFERNAEDAMERIKEAGKEMQSFFAGSDLASLAQDFSSAWLDAYREFGDTAGAIEERMEQMVENLVEKAALSGIVQNVMGDWYESLKGIKDWNAQSIADKIAEARALIPVINQGLNNAANELNAAGLDLRSTVGQFTGISRDIAGASEESINGLAAGINTQNFFLQHIDANVAAVVAALTGESETGAARRTAAGGTDPYKDQMLAYVGSLPQMRDDMAAIRLALDRVVKLNGSRYAVQVQM